MALIIFLAFSLLLHGVLGELICEEMPIELCSYSISSCGQRCLIENFKTKNGEIAYQCKTSEVIVSNDILKDWIESDACINGCGLDRNTVGISSDTLLQPQFLATFCSDQCYQSCPNIIDLYFNLAIAEGVHLYDLCANPRRALSTTASFGSFDRSEIIYDFKHHAASSPAFLGVPMAYAPETVNGPRLHEDSAQLPSAYASEPVPSDMYALDGVA